MPLQKLLHRIDQLKDELQGLLPMDRVQYERLWQKPRMEWKFYEASL